MTTSFATIVAALRPQLFVMENVERALKSETYKVALGIFARAGYKLTISVLEASLCGVPQNRKRAVVVGVLKDVESSLIDIYREMQASKPMTVRDYLGDTLGTEYYYRHPRSYARRAIFSIDEPSPTIRGVNRPIPSGYAGHPGDAISINAGKVRPLTTKERSLIQTFPQEWAMIGNKSELEQIIGNAVPVKLAEFIGKAIVRWNNDENLVSLAENDQFEYPLEKPLVQEWIVFEQAAKYKAKGLTISLQNRNEDAVTADNP